MDNKLREAQLAEIELLKKFKYICEKENIQYFLLGGTAIGAVRHGGFIPWDDDIDVALFRSDYDNFISISDKYLEANQKLLHYSVDESYPHYGMKLVDTEINFVLKKESGLSNQHIWIDIFPIDGSPNISVFRKLHYYKIYLVRMQLAFCYISNLKYDEQRLFWKKVLIAVSKKVPIGKLLNPTKIKEKLDKDLRKYPVERSRIVCNYIGAYHQKEFVPKSFFSNGSVVRFENEEYFAPKEVDKYLKHIYGDYMSLPPTEKQIPKHLVVDIINTKQKKII